MSPIDALILGLVQGIAEFLPISSSTHLQLFRLLLGVDGGSQSRYFDLVCHGGTTIAALLYLRKDFLTICRTPRQIFLLGLALLPLIPAYFLLKSHGAAASPSFLGWGLLFTAAILWIASRKKTRKKNSIETGAWKWQDMVCIGIMQTFALLPGISRSATTLAAARLRSWPWEDAARFSFILAIPSVLGGQALETLRLFQKSAESQLLLPWNCYLIGFISAFVFGLIGIHGVFRIYRSLSVRPFIYYCALLGLLFLGSSYA